MVIFVQLYLIFSSFRQKVKFGKFSSADFLISLIPCSSTLLKNAPHFDTVILLILKRIHFF